MAEKQEKQEEQIRYFEVDFQKISVKPDDIIVIRCEEFLTKAVISQIKENIKTLLPTNKILILDGGIEIGIIEKKQE